MQKPDMATQADGGAKSIAAKIPQEYTQQKGMYAFSYNGSEGVDKTRDDLSCCRMVGRACGAAADAMRCLRVGLRTSFRPTGVRAM